MKRPVPRHASRHVFRQLSWHDDEGSVTAFVAVLALGLLLVIGLVADGGAKIRAAQRADALAADAARTAGQALDQALVASGNPAQVDRNAAAAAATAYLSAVDTPGTLSISPDGRDLSVEVTVTRPTVFLQLIGITQVSATGHATVQLVHSVTGTTP